MSRTPPPPDPASSDGGLGAAVAAAVERVVRAASRHPRVVLATAGLVVVVAGALSASLLRVNADQDAMFSDELPHRVVEIAYMREFPALYENVVVVVDGDDEERVRDGAAALAARMRSEPAYFRNVYLPRGEFFEQNALLYMSTDELEDFADRLARVQPYLAGLAEDGTLRGLAMMLARGARAAREGDIDGADLAPIFERIERAIRATLDGAPYRFSWAEVVAGGALGDVDPTARARRLVIAQPVLDFGRLAAAGEPLEALRRFADELGLDGESGVRVRVTGDVALSYEEMTLVERQAAAAGVASFVLVTALLAVALRSLRLVLAVVASLLVGLVATAGFAAVAVGHLNLISVAFAVLFIGLAADFSLHLCLRYQELAAAGASREDALATTARGVGASIVLCAATTSIGFFAFVPTDFAGVAELGWIAGVGMAIGLACTFTVAPAVIALVPAPRAGPARGAQLALPSLPLRHPRTVAAAAAAATLGALALLPRVEFDENPLRVRDPDAESVRTFEELLDQSRTSPWTMAAIADDVASADALAERLRALPVVASVETVSDFIPDDQDEKLAILADASLFLAPPPTATGAAAPPGVEQQLAALRELDGELARLERAGDRVAPPALLARASKLREAMRAFVQRALTADRADELVGALEASLVGSLPAQLETLERLLGAERITYDALPEGLRDRMVSDGGRVRLEIRPREDMNDGAALARFVAAVRTVAPDATGSAVAIHEASHTVVRALREALLAALVMIALLLFAIWRALGDTLLVMTPLVLSGLATSAAAVLAGIPFNFADIIVLPLLLGIGVDSGIHLVARAREEERARDLLETSTARAIVFSALTTIASFGSLALSTHRGIASLGQLLTLGVAISLVFNLVVLPALIVLRRRRSRA
ncbi:MAG: MMPL family transporter [Myxococcales bacterium]|nr:MMPL family transporter [Myxococcales bacterium]